jgi:putative DNA primase/helicase
MTSFPPLARAAELLGGEVRGNEVLCPGPGHSDTDRSLSVKLSGSHPEGFVTHSFSGDDWEDCRAHVRNRLGLPEPKDAKHKGNGKKNGGAWTFVDEYTYRDATGAPYLLVKRYLDANGTKQFPQFHWDGANWVKGKPKGLKIPYRLPELLAAPPKTTVYFCEGEACANAVAKLSLVATTASEGCNTKWAAELTPYFKDRRVVILVDSDKGGRKHGQKVAKAIDGVAASVKVIDLYPDRNDGSDIADFLKTDTAGVDLMKKVKDAPPWEPSAAAEVKDETSGDDDGDGEDLIAELAALSRLQYAKRRKKAAKRLGITAGELDKIVAEARGEEAKPESKDRWSVDQWPESVATNDLLNDLASIYARYVILPEHGATALALWTLHAWALEAAYCSPLLMLVSPEPRCGKSTVLKLLFSTCPRTVLASNISGPAIYRYVETYTPTLLLDEAETFVADNEGVRGILNSGHDRATAIVIRQVGENHEETKEFSTWAPKAIASIGRLAATLRDRAIILPMKRKKRNEYVEKLRGRGSDEFRAIRERACRWADDNVEELKGMCPSPPDLNDRAADNWELLLAIADLAGGDWPTKARAAAVSLSGDADDRAETIGVQLLAAIKAVFETLGTDRVSSEDLAEELAKDKDSPWATYGKSERPITQRQIAAVLERYGVRPDTIRIPGLGTKKGYLFAWLADAFETYLPASPPSPPFDPEHRNKPTATGISSAFSSVTEDGVLRIENSEKPNNDGHCYGVTDQNTPLGEKQENDVSSLSESCAPEDRRADDGLGIPAFLRRCDHCGQPATPTEPLTRWDWSGRPDGVRLHKRCEETWFDTQGRPS